MDTARASRSLPTSQYRDDYRGWVSNQKDLRPTGVEVPLYESYFWRHATTTLRIMRQTPAVYDDPGYRAQYERLLAFRGARLRQSGTAGEPTHHLPQPYAHGVALGDHRPEPGCDHRGSGPPGPLPHGRRRHRPQAAEPPHRPARQLQPHPVDASAYFWNDEWGSARRPGQDVSHANGVMSYVVEAEGQGDFWTAADMARFGNLLTKVIWPGERRYAAFVDGSGSDNGWFSDGLVKLGRYDPAVQQWLERYEVVNGQFAANMALNAMIGQQAPSAESSSCPP